MSYTMVSELIVKVGEDTIPRVRVNRVQRGFYVPTEVWLLQCSLDCFKLWLKHKSLYFSWPNLGEDIPGIPFFLSYATNTLSGDWNDGGYGLLQGITRGGGDN
jgi:hypothetical protein